MKTDFETVDHATGQYIDPDIWGGTRQTLVSYQIGGADLIENLPWRDVSMIYFLLGKGRTYIGESGKGEARLDSSLRDKPWATLFLWLNMLQLGIHHNHGRKHLEALLIFNIYKSREDLGRNAHMTNVKFTRSAGRFSKEESPPYSQIDKIISDIMKCIRAYKDPHGNYTTHGEILHDGATGHEAQSVSRKRMSSYGRPGPLKFRSFELRLRTSTNQ